MCARVLFARRGRREGDARYQHSPLTRCVPPPRLKDSPSHLPRAPPHSQVSTVYLHHEHCQYPRHSHHYKLELPRASDPLDAKLDPSRVHQVSAHLPLHAETQEDPVTVDDGDAGRPAVLASHASSSAPDLRLWPRVAGARSARPFLAASPRPSQASVPRAQQGTPSRADEEQNRGQSDIIMEGSIRHPGASLLSELTLKQLLS